MKDVIELTFLGEVPVNINRKSGIKLHFPWKKKIFGSHERLATSNGLLFYGWLFN